MLRAAAAHEGTALVEIYQNCNIFNDGAFERPQGPRDPRRVGRSASSTASRSASARRASTASCARPTARLQIVEVADVGEDALLVHDAHAADPSAAFALSRLADIDALEHTPIGVFRDVERPVYDALMADQIAKATETSGAGRPPVADRRQRHLDHRLARQARRLRTRSAVARSSSAGRDGKSLLM